MIDIKEFSPFSIENIRLEVRPSFQPIQLHDICKQKILSSLSSINGLYNVKLNIPDTLLKDIMEKDCFYVNVEKYFSIDSKYSYWEESILL